MIRPALARLAPTLLALALLAACGADGLPTPPPERDAAPAGVLTVTGEGRFGVTASNG